MDLTVKAIEDIGPVRILHLDRNGVMPDYQAGHYALLQFGDHDPRPYSIASPPNNPTMEFHIRNTGHHGGSAFATTTLQIGDTVLCHGTGGNYQYQSYCLLPLLLIAGGTGLAPLLAIAHASLADCPERPVTIYHGGRHLSDLYRDAILKQIASAYPAFRYIPVLSDDVVDGVAHGLVGGIALDNLSTPHRIYIAGPVDMVRSTYDKALHNGIAPDVIHSDLAEMTGKI